ncbi:unnamed protein product [Vicia faba]|uniref:RRM domain-containing protein n=1 Tax=Vicia faba TaxID=3906 RepID=A0AAV1AMA5_VICFA|nr:unnamed protein product [Vicia faba]
MALGSGSLFKPQIALFPRSVNSKQSQSKITFSPPTKFPTTLSLSISASNVLRNAPFPLFCCIADSTSSTSSVECNMPSSTKIFIKGLPLSTSEVYLAEVFSVFGEVTKVKLLKDKESGQSLGFAYIWFFDEESAQSAANETNGKFFDGRFIYVTIAKPGSSKNLKRRKVYKF